MKAASATEHTLIVPAALAGQRLDAALAQLLAQYSRASLKQWIDQGQVTLAGRAVKPRTRVNVGDRIVVLATLAASAELTPQAVTFDLVFVDDDVIVVDKPAGVVVHPGAGNPDSTLVNGLLERFPELAALPRAGLVHRIDKDTSGLLIAARSPLAYQVLVRALAAREIAREYLAIVNGVLVAGGTITGAIARDPQQRTRMRVADSGRHAVTHFRVQTRYRAHTALAVSLETGRTHQIRVHLAWRGHPLIGDSRYGSRPRPPPAAAADLITLLERFPRQALHAQRLVFAHPVTAEDLCFEAPLPADIRKLQAALAADQVTAQVDHSPP